MDFSSEKLYEILQNFGGWAVKVVGKLFEKVVIQGFADRHKKVGVDGVAVEDVIASGFGTVDGFGKPNLRPSLPFQLGFYAFSYVYRHRFCPFALPIPKTENHYSITPYKTKTWELTLLPVPRSKALAMPIRQKRATPKAHVYVHTYIQYVLYT